jgi:5-methylcytosine-specific restriction endonuclease McrA
MAYIYLPKKKDNRKKRGRSKEGSKFYNRKWSKARNRQLEKQPLCQFCLAFKNGFLSATENVHHLVKFMDAQTDEKRKELFEDPDNHYSVCVECHSYLDNELYDISKLIYRMRKEGQSDELIHAYILKEHGERIEKIIFY